MPSGIIKSFAKKSGKTEKEVEKIWNELKNEYGEDYAKITGTLKKILGLNESKVSFREFLKESKEELNKIKEKYKDTMSKINVYEFGDKLSIDLIVVKEKNSGVGSKFMQELCDYADKKKLTMILTPSNEFGGNVKRLIEFYKRFGFVENKGKNKVFEIFERMYREPK